MQTSRRTFFKNTAISAVSSYFLNKVITVKPIRIKSTIIQEPIIDGSGTSCHDDDEYLIADGINTLIENKDMKQILVKNRYMITKYGD